MQHAEPKTPSSWRADSSSNVDLWAWTSGLSIAFSYVVSLYIHPSGSKIIGFPKGDRNDPHEIRRRFQKVFFASLFSCAVSVCFQLRSGSDMSAAFHRMGFKFSGFLPAITLPILLTLILFSGALLSDYLQGRFRGYNQAFFSLLWYNLHYRRRILRDTIYSWMWWRAYVVAPLSEEFVYRACLIPVIAWCYGTTTAVFLSPLAFGVAHLHHIFDRVRHGAPVAEAISSTLFQIFYTFVFGVYSAFLFVRTGHIVAPILVHALCNRLGVPDVEPLVKGASSQRMVVGLTHLAGFTLWLIFLYPWTEPSLYGPRELV
ncbi:hypothetical protein RvY_14722 [Ramazzottius varieornatus]|uniref:CAAX prenyl protease 2 n=1 Tax=Ramazzottius varieornatus TaxID=947166 RepID=A0A1D1VXC2_RAMVA|nr:hypothetical protein RvY_14722 [Ramazzottius varieornatus]